MTSGPIEPSRSLSAERDLALDRLRDAYATGHLSYDDFGTRLDAVMAAGTPDAVSTVVASLPARAPDRAVRIGGISGRIRRTGSWSVPRRLLVESEYGSVDLDFVQAVFEAPVVDLELALTFGGARLVVPLGSVVDIDELRTDWKQPRYTPPERPGSAGVLIRVTGRMEYGRLKVRHARR